jgi:hypothetical protein
MLRVKVALNANPQDGDAAAPARRAALGVCGAIIIGAALSTSTFAEVPARSVAAKHARTVPATKVSKQNDSAHRGVVSPYARAAGEHARNARTPSGHAPAVNASVPAQTDAAGRP